MSDEWCWHGHHQNTSPLELLSGTIEERRKVILATKPVEEQKLRLRLLQPVRGELPAALIRALATRNEAGAIYDEAGAIYEEALATYDEAAAIRNEAFTTYDKARVIYDKALTTFDQVINACLPEILALHATECPDCPWDGESIFGKENG